MKITEIKEKLRSTLKSSRYEHTIGVAYTAASLAMCYDSSLVEKALIAGLLHDCGKFMSDKENFKYCKEHSIELSEYEIETPGLIHAKIGVDMAKRIYGETDKCILDAIRWHTTGRPDMSLLEKIIFTADYIEPARDHDPLLPKLREMAFKDLDRCIVNIYHNTLNYINGSGKKLDPMTTKAYEFYLDRITDERDFKTD